MPKSSSAFICQQCGFRSSQFLGRCPQCGEWSSLVETIETVTSDSNNKNRNIPSEVVDLSNIQAMKYERISTGLSEFDRCLGGGIVKGSIILISGDPGVGKSTLLTQLALNIDKQTLLSKSDQKDHNDLDDNSVLYVAGEESAQQIKIRVDRMQSGAKLLVLNETDVDNIISIVEKQRPKLMIVDSIQTLETTELSSAPGSVGQVRESAHRLQHLAKSLHIPIFLVGHITKEGNVAGPKILEHLVDVVLSLEGEQATNLRTLRASKNRFGATDEIGIFEMEEGGMKEVINPSAFFLEQQQTNSPGSVIVPTLNGLRPILVEVQALVTKSYLPIPRRSANGLDSNRLQLLTAVISKRLGVNLGDQDVFVNVTGGLRVNEPAIDLGICLAIISSFKNICLPKKITVLGEVGLLGEVRRVNGLSKRTSEAKKLGFSQVLSSENVKTLEDAVKLCGLDGKRISSSGSLEKALL